MRFLSLVRVFLHRLFLCPALHYRGANQSLTLTEGTLVGCGCPCGLFRSYSTVGTYFAGDVYHVIGARKR